MEFSEHCRTLPYANFSKTNGHFPFGVVWCGTPGHIEKLSNNCLMIVRRFVLGNNNYDETLLFRWTYNFTTTPTLALSKL